MVWLFRLLSLLPLRFLHAVGAFLGAMVYWTSSRERERVSDNLRLAYPGGVPSGLAWKSALSAGRSMVELPWLWGRPIEETVLRVDSVSGWERIEEAQSRGEALLFFTPHIGCFEMVGQYIGTKLPITCLYRAPKNPALLPIYDEGRNRGQMRGAAADAAGVRALVRALRQKQAVGILPDQVPQHGEGEWVPFFGRPAYTMTLAARFSQMKGVSVFFVYATRESGAKYAFFSQPARFSEASADDEILRATEINQQIEAIIHQRPDQYFWSYNRYKSPHAGAHLKLDAAQKAGDS